MNGWMVVQKVCKKGLSYDGAENVNDDATNADGDDDSDDEAGVVCSGPQTKCSAGTC